MSVNRSSAARNRPRVAAIGLDESQLAEIRPYCGDLRPAQSVSDYLHAQRFSWSETDIVVARGLFQAEIDAGVHLLTIGTMSVGVWQPPDRRPGSTFREHVRVDTRNRQRELEVALQCPPIYNGLAEMLVNQLADIDEPPTTVTVSEADELLREPIVVTRRGYPVALRLLWTDRDWGDPSEVPAVDVVALYLPEPSNLSQWFGAFLTDISEVDSLRVPEPPSLLVHSSDWYTPEEAALARRISDIDEEIERLNNERQGVERELATAGKMADATVRRAIWEDGDELVDAVSQILEELGFAVEQMDDGKQPHEAKHEDLRLTVADRLDWEAIVEVKGYTKGIKTNHAQQVRMHRERYLAETGLKPDLTVWLVNPWREMAPSNRPYPDSNVDETAKIIGAVCLLSTDLYQLWKSLKAGDSAQDDVVEQLVEAEAGLWRPSLNP